MAATLQEFNAVEFGRPILLRTLRCAAGENPRAQVKRAVNDLLGSGLSVSQISRLPKDQLARFINTLQPVPRSRCKHPSTRIAWCKVRA